MAQELKVIQDFYDRHTSKFIPWRLVAAVYFADKAKAEAFERYMKQGFGHAYAI